VIGIRGRRLLLAGSIAGIACIGASPVMASGAPTGEHMVGQVSIEPAYDDTTGNLIYLATPVRSPFPTHTNSHSVAPLYLIEYPPSYPGWTLNCMGVPGNCPDHDGIVAGVATSVEPGVYGSNPTLVPGHDHLVAPPAGGGDFNIAWEVHEIVFTNAAAADTHLTTLAQIEAAVGSGNALNVDLGFAFHCSVVSSAVYAQGG
jgi:hypothetical protein